MARVLGQPGQTRRRRERRRRNRRGPLSDEEIALGALRSAAWSHWTRLGEQLLTLADDSDAATEVLSQIDLAYIHYTQSCGVTPIQLATQLVVTPHGHWQPICLVKHHETADGWYACAADTPAAATPLFWSRARYRLIFDGAMLAQGARDGSA